MSQPRSARQLSNGARYDKVRRWRRVPMAALGIALAVIILIQYAVDLSGPVESRLDTASWVIWACFVVEYAVLFLLAEDRNRMVRAHKLDLLLILLPMLRPLRLLAPLRAFAGVAALSVAAGRVLRKRNLDWFLLATIGVVLAGATIVWWLEGREPDPAITTFGDALWWAIVTCTTVGYGDAVPVSAAGRVLAVVLMLVGIGMLSVVTANIAAAFVQDDSESDSDASATARLDQIDRDIQRLHTKLDELLGARELDDPPEKA